MCENVTALIAVTIIQQMCENVTALIAVTIIQQMCKNVTAISAVTINLNNTYVKLMKENFFLRKMLSDFSIILLEFIQNQCNENRDKTITLQYRYLQALFGCSENTIKSAIDQLFNCRIIDEVAKNYGECALYRYNHDTCQALIKQAKSAKCTLITGRNKTRQQVTKAKIVGYMVGKGISKTAKLRHGK